MQKKMNPAQRVAGRARECFVVATNAPENKAATRNFQLAVADGAIDDIRRLRVHHLIGEFGLSEPMAELIADLAFHAGRRA